LAPAYLELSVAGDGRGLTQETSLGSIRPRPVDAEIIGKALASAGASLADVTRGRGLLGIEEGGMSDHAVIVHFDYGSKDLGRLFELEDKLESAIGAAEAGEYDGNEIAVDGSDGFLYMYGPDADLLADAILPALEATPWMKGARLTKRYGPPEDGVREVELVVGG
jgi:hypothetical protein